MVSLRRLNVVVVALTLVLGMSVSIHANKLTLLGNVNATQLAPVLENFFELSGYEVEVIQVGWDQMPDRILTMIAAGTPPDVIYQSGQVGAELTPLGIHLAIDSYIERDGIDLTQFPPTSISTLTHHGQLTALPIAISIATNQYNMDMFDSAGLQYPPASWDDQGWKLEDFINAGRLLTQDRDGDGSPEVFGIAPGEFQPWTLLGMFELDFYDAETLKFTGSEPEQVAAMERLAPMWTEFQMVGGNFVNGTAGMGMSTSPILNNLVNADVSFRWSLAPTPSVARRAAFAGIHSLGIIRNTSNPDAAWELVKYLTYNQDGNWQVTQAFNRVPVLRPSAAAFVDQWDAMHPEANVQVMVDGFLHMWWSDAVFGANGPTIRGLLEQAWRRVASGEQSVLGAHEEIAPQVDELLQARR